MLYRFFWGCSFENHNSILSWWFWLGKQFHSPRKHNKRLGLVSLFLEIKIFGADNFVSKTFHNPTKHQKRLKGYFGNFKSILSWWFCLGNWIISSLGLPHPILWVMGTLRSLFLSWSIKTIKSFETWETAKPCICRTCSCGKHKCVQTTSTTK